MAHDRDHDHPPVGLPPKAKAPPLVSKAKPDSTRREHPESVPREPVDPRTHPGRW